MEMFNNFSFFCTLDEPKRPFGAINVYEIWRASLQAATAPLSVWCPYTGTVQDCELIGIGAGDAVPPRSSCIA